MTSPSAALRTSLFGQPSSPKVSGLSIKQVQKRIEECRDSMLSLNNFLLTTAMIPGIVEAINANLNITQVDLSNNVLDSDAIPYLTKLENVTYLNLSHNEINSKNLELLVNCDGLTYLDLCDNNIDETGEALIEQAKSGASIVIVHKGYHDIAPNSSRS